MKMFVLKIFISYWMIMSVSRAYLFLNLQLIFSLICWFLQILGKQMFINNIILPSLPISRWFHDLYLNFLNSIKYLPAWKQFPALFKTGAEEWWCRKWYICDLFEMIYIFWTFEPHWNHSTNPGSNRWPW